MPPKRLPLKGEPNFTAISDSKLREFIDLTEELRFAYEHFDEEKAKVIKAIWKELCIESTNRKVNSSVKELSRQEDRENAPLKVHTIKMAKRIKSRK